MRLSLALLLSAAAVVLSPFEASAADPNLSIILPRGGQRGTEQVFRFSGARLQDAEQILFYEPGFEVLEIKAADANNIDVKVKIAPDCAIGEHTAQVRTKSGISDYRTFFVGALPTVEEKEPNTDFAAPQAVDLNVTVSGTVTNEDVDYYVVNATKGQRISVEVEGMRFGQTLFDPYIAILNDKRFELSAVDDSPLVKQDAATSIIAPEDGKYIVEMRDSGYGGDGNCRYRLHIGTFPRPTAAYPAGGKAGEASDVTFIGDASGPITKNVAFPAEGAETTVYIEDASGIAPSGHILRVSPNPNAMEAEPNNGFENATVVAFPSSFNGILQEPGDVDFFKFTAKAGQVFEVECYGRRIRSPIDPVMNLYKATGEGITGNDDSRGPDSYFRWQIPADGDYALRIADHLNRGGAEFTYRVEFQEVKPSLNVGIPRVARYSQSRQQIYVPRGNRYATLISAERINFGGELTIDGVQLPPGITIVAPPMAANMNVMPVVFEAAADAPLAGALVDFKMKPTDPALAAVSGRFQNRADFVIAGPGQSLYVWKDVDRLPVAVTEELPFTLEIVQPNVPIVRNGMMLLKVVAKKKEGWDENIQVQFPYRPPGIGANSEISIPKGQTEGLYQINADANAAIGKWPVYALGYANINGSAWASTQMATIEIAEPYVGLTVQRSSVEQGKETDVVVEVQVLKELKAPAVVTLVGLPHKVTAEPLQITAETKELVFKVKTAPDSPEGTHKNVFCQVTVVENNENIVHARVGDSELRIDKPLPLPTAAPMPAPMPAAAAAAPAPMPAPPVEKRLTRLEKLRLESQKKAGGAPAAP